MKKGLPFFITLFALLLLTNTSFAVGINPVNPTTTETESVTTKQTKKEKRLSKKKARKEKRQMKKQIRKNLKQSIKDWRGSGSSDISLLLLIILAILIPPLAVGLYDGLSRRFWISLILTLLFFIPGIIYSLIVILE